MPHGAGIVVHWFGGATPTGDHSECGTFVRNIQTGAFNDANNQGPYIDIPYNLLACIHGFVYVGRGVGVESAAQGEYNSSDYAVCALLGTSGWTSPTPQLLTALQDAINDLRTTGGATGEVICHSDLMSTDCPGADLRAWVKSGNEESTGGGTSGGVPAVALGSRQLNTGVSAGSDVEWLQQQVGVPVDGDFGPQTQGGVMCWQHLHGLANDGVVGPITWNSLGHPMP